MPAAAISTDEIRHALAARAGRGRGGDLRYDEHWATEYDQHQHDVVFHAPDPGADVLLNVPTLLGGLLAQSVHLSGADPRYTTLRERVTELMRAGCDRLPARVEQVTRHPAVSADQQRVAICLPRSVVIVACPELDEGAPVAVDACELLLDSADVLRFMPPETVRRAAGDPDFDVVA